MALAEAALRSIHKYGLVPKIIRLLPIISFVCALCSCIWLAVLPLDGNYRRTYISENALMPAQVTSYFRESEWNFVRGYRDELRHYGHISIEAKNNMVEEWLQDIGIKTGYHHIEDENTPDTLYGIMHAPRGDDTEAMVLAVPWITSDNQYNLGGASLGLALMKYFTRMSIWSKNIILVFPKDGHTSLRSWVEAYHTSLDMTGGSIEAAIVMEYPGDADRVDYYEINYEGLNGQLPNLDLLNTANQVGYQENLHCSIQGVPGHLVTLNTYFSRLKTFVKGIISLAMAGLTKPVNGCESFSGWQIQAFTIRAKGTKGPADITQFGRIIDSTFRSVNNLLEKFHQSFFFYLLLSPRLFVSIGTYLPSAVLVALSYALSSLSCLLNSNISILDFLINIKDTLIFFVIVEFKSYLMAIALPYFVKMTHNEEDHNVLINLILVFFTMINMILSLSPFIKKFIPLTINQKTSYSIIAFSLFFISMVITALLVLNFSLALIMGLIALPLTFTQQLLKEIATDDFKQLVKPSNFIDRSKSKLKLAGCLFISNPFFMIIIVGNLYVPGDDGVINLMSGLLTSWDDLQCWTWYIVMLSWFPCWLSISLACLLGKFETNKVSIEKKKE